MSKSLVLLLIVASAIGICVVVLQRSMDSDQESRTKSPGTTSHAEGQVQGVTTTDVVRLSAQSTASSETQPPTYASVEISTSPPLSVNPETMKREKIMFRDYPEVQ